MGSRQEILPHPRLLSDHYPRRNRSGGMGGDSSRSCETNCCPANPTRPSLNQGGMFHVLPSAAAVS